MNEHRFAQTSTHRSKHRISQLFSQLLTFQSEDPACSGFVKMVGYMPTGPGVWDRVMERYSFAYLIGGGGVYRDDNGYSQELTPGDCVFAFPGLRHSYGPLAGQTWSEVFAVFSGPVFELWQSVGLLDPARPVRHLEPIEYWVAKIRAFSEAMPPKSWAERELSVCRLLQLLTEILTEGGEPQQNSAWLDRARGLLQADVSEVRSLDAIADELGIPYETFRKRFQSATGVSPGRYRALHRIEAARELLRRTELTQRQIADTLGYSDEFHFSKRFKQLTGVTPREFRVARVRPRVSADQC